MTIGVVVMAYGGPLTLDEVEPFLHLVRGGRPTPISVLDAVRQRYEVIGGGSPILERTEAQARALSRAISATSAVACEVVVGMLHWTPSIEDALRQLQSLDVSRAVGVVMAPHYSKLSIGKYEDAIAAASTRVEVCTIESWHLLDGYLNAIVARIEDALGRFSPEERTAVQLIFTAHSLPERILAWSDPYPDQLQETVTAVMERLELRPHHFAYQSAAKTHDPWLGPDAGQLILDLASQGHHVQLIVPIGFTSDHVEILYDIDVEFRQIATSCGVHLERIDMLNDSEQMMAGLADLAVQQISDRRWA